MRVNRVLVVDDCERAALACKTELGERHVQIAYTAERARELVRREQFDLAIVDQRLGPGHAFGDGLVLVEEFKREHPAMFVALVSGWLTDECEHFARSRGADIAISKVVENSGDWIPLHVILGYVEHGATIPTTTRDQTLDRVSREHIIDVVRSCNGCVSRAARTLGIPRWTLTRKLGEMSRAETGPRPSAASGSNG